MVTCRHSVALPADSDPGEGNEVAHLERYWVAAAVAAFAAACSEGETHKAERTLTSTVTLSLEDTLAVDSVISGERRSEEIYATLHAVVTASTSTRAESIASKLAILVERRERVVSISVPVPTDTVLMGDLVLRVPADLKIQAVNRGDTVDLSGIDADIRVSSRSHVKVSGAKESVLIGVVNGNALVDAELDPGSSVQIFCENGNVELKIPSAISADISALVKTRGTVVPNHPQLPPFRGSAGQVYRTRIGDGLSSVALETSVGNIVITTR
jgi:hypothetical protein